MDNQPIQEQQEYRETLPVETTRISGLNNLLIGCVLFVVIIIVGVAAYLLGRNTVSSPVHIAQNQNKQANPLDNSSLALIPYVPHFNKLSLEDLANFSDVRNVYDFNGHKLIIGDSSIVEYDTAQNKFVRQINPDVIDCVYSSAKIGNMLFIGCNGKTNNDYSTLYQIDLSSGKLVKRYEWFTTKGYKMENISLASEGNSLWISSWEGVMKMDIETGQTVFYKVPKVVPNNCTIDDIWTEGGKIIVHSGDYSCINGEAVFDAQANTWQFIKTDTNTYPQRINKSLSDFSLDIPQFYGLSELVNGKYYLFSQKGVYTLKKGQFPTLLFPLTIVGGNVTAKSFVSTDETKAVIIGGYFGMAPQNPTVNNLVVAYIIDLQAKEITDIVKNNPAYSLPATQKQQQDIEAISNATLEQSAEGVLLKDAKGLPIASVDFQKRTLTLE